MKKYLHRCLAMILAAGICVSAANYKDVFAQATTQNTQETQEVQNTENTEDADKTDKTENTENTQNAEDGTQTTIPETNTTTIPSLQPTWLKADGAPEITAGAALLIDQTTGTILYEKNADAKMYPASMTKILTALVAMDYLKPDDLIVVGTEINEVTLDSSKAGHKVGETITVENVLRGLLIPSGNDSGNVLAAAVAKKVENDENISFAKSEAIFTDLMNQKAEELGAINSHFTNTHGYHDDNHYSCAHDMALFAMAFMQNETLAEIAAEKSFLGNGADGQAVDETKTFTQDYNWVSHNLLVTDNTYQYPYAIGIKTGFTDEAGECLTAAAEKDGRKLISVLFHGEDPTRWTETASLFDYGFNNYEQVELVAAGAAIEELPLTKQNRLQGDTVPLVYQEPLIAILPVGASQRLTNSVTIDETYQEEAKDGTMQVKAPLQKGEQIATVTYTLDGAQVAQLPAYAGADIEKATIFNQIQYFFQSLFNNLFTLKGLIGLVIVVVVIAAIFLVLRRVRSGGGRHRRSGYTLRTGSRRRGRRRW